MLSDVFIGNLEDKTVTRAQLFYKELSSARREPQIFAKLKYVCGAATGAWSFFFPIGRSQPHVCAWKVLFLTILCPISH